MLKKEQMRTVVIERRARVMISSRIRVAVRAWPEVLTIG